MNDLERDVQELMERYSIKDILSIISFHCQEEWKLKT